MADIIDITLELQIHLRRWSKVAQALRERTTPLPLNICVMLADKVDPEVKDKRGRRAAEFEKNQRDRFLCRAHGYHRARIGTNGGPINEEDARGWTCDAMGASESTLRNALQRYPEEIARYKSMDCESLKEENG